MLTHEETHHGQPCPLPKCGECEAYKKEQDCLSTNRLQCDLRFVGTQRAKCYAAFNEQLRRVKDMIQTECEGCDERPQQGECP